MPGDPVWLMLIGPSSDGKSEILRSFTQPEDKNVDDITPKTFISGYRSKKTDDIPHFAEEISGKILFIYDMSPLMSKHAEERSQVLSDMRMIYDGKLSKRFGNKLAVEVKTENTTFICGSTPVIDQTLLEDQLMGTRFLTYRIHTRDRNAVMKKIMANMENMSAMRNSLNMQVRIYERNIKIKDYELTQMEKDNLMTFANQTTLLRSSPALDRSKEPTNLMYSEGPGRLYKQLYNLYKGYRVIGLTEEEAYHGMRNICQFNVVPSRLEILKYLEGSKEGYHTTSEIARNVKLGKGHTKGQMYSLYQLGLADYQIKESNFREIDQWKLLDCNFNLIIPKVKQQVLTTESNGGFSRLEESIGGRCGYCGRDMILTHRDGNGNHACQICAKDYEE